MYHDVSCVIYQYGWYHLFQHRCISRNVIPSSLNPKEISNLYHFKVFGMTWPMTKFRSPAPKAQALMTTSNINGNTVQYWRSICSDMAWNIFDLFIWSFSLLLTIFMLYHDLSWESNRCYVYVCEPVVMLTKQPWAPRRENDNYHLKVLGSNMWPSAPDADALLLHHRGSKRRLQ